MATEQQRRLMQEALDDVLSEEARQELFSILDEDEATFTEYNQLHRVHQMLKTAPQERAPRRLASTIMARLAESLEAGQHTQGQASAQLEMSREIIGVALTLVTVATMPLLVAASWMVIHSLADPSVLTLVLQRIVGFLLLVLEIMEVFMEKAQELARTDQNAALALLALIPVTLLAMVRYMLSDDRKP
jgi:hypothetical protein